MSLRMRVCWLAAAVLLGVASWWVMSFVSATPVKHEAVPASGQQLVGRGDFPNASTSGIPKGLQLTPYEGPCAITDGSTVTIDGRDILASCPSLTTYSGHFVITRSLVPRVLVGWPGTVTLTDSEVDGGADPSYSALATNNTTPVPPGRFNLTALRVHVQRGKDSVECSGGCRITDSFLHNQQGGRGAHVQAFLSSGGSSMVIEGSTLWCTALPDGSGSGCTADLALFGDDARVDDVKITGNLFVAGDNFTRCLYAGAQPGKAFPVATRVEVIGNVFQRGRHGLCGSAGPVTSFDPKAPGARWERNTWDDGSPLPPPEG